MELVESIYPYCLMGLAYCLGWSFGAKNPIGLLYGLVFIIIPIFLTYYFD